MGKQKAPAKTNAMRQLDNLKINYTATEYEVEDGHIDAESVAQKIGRLPDEVFKTLVTISPSRKYYIFVVPATKELDLKKCAAACGEKSVEMIHVKDINSVTGYIRGGCSPVGMKKSYPTFIDQSGQELPEITVSAGKIGMQISLKPEDLQKACGGKWADIAK